MRAVVCTNKVLRVEERPEPVPGPGQVLLNVLRCGICGSDLHARQHCDHWGGLMERTGYTRFMRPEQDIVMGHEFCGEIAGYGPETRKTLKSGTRVCALPILRSNGVVELIGYSETCSGGYAERVVVEETLIERD